MLLGVSRVRIVFFRLNVSLMQSSLYPTLSSQLALSQSTQWTCLTLGYISLDSFRTSSLNLLVTRVYRAHVTLRSALAPSLRIFCILFVLLPLTQLAQFHALPCWMISLDLSHRPTCSRCAPVLQWLSLYWHFILVHVLATCSRCRDRDRLCIDIVYIELLSRTCYVYWLIFGFSYRSRSVSCVSGHIASRSAGPTICCVSIRLCVVYWPSVPRDLYSIFHQCLPLSCFCAVRCLGLLICLVVYWYFFWNGLRGSFVRFSCCYWGSLLDISLV